jgi:G:T-mismatch repair DNA endonuclease (very short patch repair protein)
MPLVEGHPKTVRFEMGRMSRRNDPLSKSQRRAERDVQKRTALKKIGHGGVIVRATDVRRQRYLADNDLPYSPTMAAVALPRGKANGRTSIF